MARTKEDVSGLRRAAYGLIGAAIAAVAFFPLTFFSMTIVNPSNTDSYLVLLFCWVPGAILGALGGYAIAAIAQKHFGRVGPWLGVIAGGFIGSILAVALMSYWIHVEDVAMRH
jgi:sterol desaturase/sphingolipid hydroxylase (fatty acid hydroxylase superfamily)